MGVIPDPVANANRRLKLSEKSYAVIEKECLALVWAIQKLHKIFVWQSNYSDCTVEIDHEPLSYLNSSKLANVRLMRWALALLLYRFHILTIRGAQNVGANYLSHV